jgi:hypothetical protein
MQSLPTGQESDTKWIQTDLTISAVSDLRAAISTRHQARPAMRSATIAREEKVGERKADGLAGTSARLNAEVSAAT